MAAVQTELGAMPGASERPGLVQICLRLAEDLDTASFGSSHAALSKALRDCLDQLRTVGARRGRLAGVVALSARQAKAAGPIEADASTTRPR